MRVLITCGPTWVPIDDVRVISNISTGEIGHLIAEAFIESGAEVTVIQGPVTHQWAGQKARILPYRYFDELKTILEEELKSINYDVVVHAAAVSDYKVEDRVKGKIDSHGAISLALVPTEKLIGRIKEINPNLILVGFKLSVEFLNPGPLYQQTLPLFEKGCDWVIANSFEGGYRALFVRPGGHSVLFVKSKKAVAEELVDLLKQIST